MRSYLAILAPYNIPISTLAAGTQSDEGFFGLPVPHSHMLGVELSDFVGLIVGVFVLASEADFFDLALQA